MYEDLVLDLDLEVMIFDSKALLILVFFLQRPGWLERVLIVIVVRLLRLVASLLLRICHRLKMGVHDSCWAPETSDDVSLAFYRV